MAKKYINPQELFWQKEYAENYIAKNKEFDRGKGVEAWRLMLKEAQKIASVLECGCNIGRNIGFLEKVLPKAEKSVIEISKPAFDLVTKKHSLKNTFNGSILEAQFKEKFDLVFTMGVLIHIHPKDLRRNMQKLYQFSKKYILIGEYFNRTPVMINYQGKKNRLFKRDFGKKFLQNHLVSLVDYGFLWGYCYDNAGFDDITWWLFQK
jgi:pseudaminic acid biosynthesis-associated methylase